jgi:hypothetical protein
VVAGGVGAGGLVRPRGGLGGSVRPRGGLLRGGASGGGYQAEAVWAGAGEIEREVGRWWLRLGVERGPRPAIWSEAAGSWDAAAVAWMCERGEELLDGAMAGGALVWGLGKRGGGGWGWATGLAGVARRCERGGRGGNEQNRSICGGGAEQRGGGVDQGTGRL